MMQKANPEISGISYERELNFSLFDSIPSLVTYIDSNLNYHYVNATYEKWLGVCPAAIIGKNVSDISGKKDFKKIKKYIDTVLSGKTVQFESEIRYPADTRFIHITYTPDFAENGQVRGYFSFINDITTQKTTEAEEKKQSAPNERLKEQAFQESEHKYRQLIEILPAAIYTCDARGYITLYNKTAATLWGREPEIGKDMWCGSWKIFSPADGSPIPLSQCPMAIALKEKRAVEGEEIIVECPDGNRYHVQPYPKPLFDNSGVLVGAVNLLMDVTPRKQIEKVLAEAVRTIEKNAEDLQLMVETIPQMAWTSNPDGAVIYVNKAWYDFTGAEDLSGWNWEKHVYRDDHERTYTGWINSIKTGEPFEIEYRWVRHDGAVRWMLGRANPIKNTEGQIHMWIGTATDIHDQKLINEKKDEFIGIASHELKTPLTCLKAYTQLLERSLEEKGEPTAKNYVQKTNEYIDRLNSLISDLLNVSKIQAGKLTLSLSEFDFDEFAKENIESIKQTHPSHQILLKGETHAWVYGDKQRLEQVFTNYLLNAIKYSPKADKVLVSLSMKNGMVQVAVTDFGIGIPQENIKHLFNRFYRVESQAGNFQGLGLGLYIVSEIIQRHEGKTWAESKVNQGSTFYFTIPALKK